MEKQTWMNLLYDFYGQLLTERQQRFLELYYCHDLSLGEISEQFGVSRQSVYDTLKRSEQALDRYEEKLGLVARSLSGRASLAQAIDCLKKGDKAGLLRAEKILSTLIREEI